MWFSVMYAPLSNSPERNTDYFFSNPQIIQKYLAKDAKPPFGRLREVMESLIDGLVEDDEALVSILSSLHGECLHLRFLLDIQNVMDCIKTVYIINCAVPSLLTTAKATLLLPFLKSSATVCSLRLFFPN